jgi:hypothetical protein
LHQRRPRQNASRRRAGSVRSTPAMVCNIEAAI